MYSGGYETSHGDSWIAALCFSLYIAQKIKDFPHLAGIINEFIMLGFLGIVVYGDDNLWWFPRILRDIINVRDYAHFLSTVCDMTLRDYKEYESFLSVVDQYTGLVIKEGPKFLKTYFIANDDLSNGLSPVLPFRPITELVVKSFVDVNCTVEQILIKQVSLAWNSYGTNFPVYDTAKECFKILRSSSNRTPRQMYETLLESRAGRDGLNKIVSQIGITVEQLFDHFPSLEMLRSRHVYSEAKSRFDYDPEQSGLCIVETRGGYDYVDQEVPIDVY